MLRVDNVNDIGEHRYNIVTSGSDSHIVYVLRLITIHNNCKKNRDSVTDINGNRYNNVTGGTDCHMIHVDLNFMVSKVNVNNVDKNRYNIVTGGTDCHIVHVDLKRSPVAISGAKGELVLEEVYIILSHLQNLLSIFLPISSSPR